MQLNESLLKDLPMMPPVASRILSLTAEGGEISFQKLEETISLDPMLAGRILKTANSAMYARQREVSTIRAAITLIGYKTIRSLVVIIGASSTFRKDATARFYSRFWQHALLTAFLARECASHTTLSGRKEELFLAGLLHDIGQVAMFHADRSGYEGLIEERTTSDVSMRNLEREKYGIDHRELGKEILTRWNFPDLFVDTAREHGTVNVGSRHKNAVFAVTLSDIVAVKVTDGDTTPEKVEILSQMPALLSIEPSLVTYLEGTFPALVQKDPFFVECGNLLNIATTLSLAAG